MALASELFQKYNVFVLEKNSKYGRETSSRNSEVVHSAINYPSGTLRAKLCLEGNELIRRLCTENNFDIPYKQIGKLIIAQDKDGIETLEKKLIQAQENGVKNILRISESELKDKEPNIRAKEALLIQSTGIISAHSFMDYLFNKSKENGVEILPRNEVIYLEKTTEGYKVRVKSDEGDYEFTTDILINAAGLNAHKISQMLGINIKQYYCKGDYFSVGNGKNKLVSKLIYPVVKQNHPGLGTHITLGLNGEMRLGPDTTYIDEATEITENSYRVDENKTQKFYEDVHEYFPPLRLEDLIPVMSGIRPKLQGPGEPWRDFYIQQDLPGFINLLGIESPGLTSSLAIARYVCELIK